MVTKLERHAALTETTFSDWQLVTGGKYSLEGNSLILYCYDSRIHKFYYDRANDTVTQESTNDVYMRTN